MANNGTAPDLQAIRDEITRIYNSTEDYTQQANMQPYNSGMTRDQIASIYYDGAVPSANDIPVLQPTNQQPIQAQTPTQKQNTPTTTQKPQKDVEMERAKEIGRQALKDAKSSVYGQGNIDLHNRPKYRQNDGSISTVNSMSFQDEDGKEVLIPTIAYDKNGKPTQLTDDEAIDRYYQTGEYLGKFNTVDEADKYAQKLHKDQEDYYLNGGNKRSLSANEQRDMERAMNARKEAEDRRKKTVTETVKTEEQLSGAMPSEITSGTVNKRQTDLSTRNVMRNQYALADAIAQNAKEDYSIQSNRDDSNYVVPIEKYNELMKNPDLAKDINTLEKVIYNNADQDATVSPEWAETFGAKNITGGYTEDEFYDLLSDKYGLDRQQLSDMALTRHADITNRENEQYQKDLNRFGEKHPVLGSAFSLAGTIGSGTEGLVNTALGGITGDNRYASNMFNATKQAPREGARERIDSNVGDTLYDLGMGVADMGAGAATGSAPAILAGNTANEAYLSALDRGSSARQAAAYAGVSGAVDFIANKIGLDKAKSLALDSVKSAGIKRMLIQNGIAGLGEAGENVLQDIAQTIADEFINNKNSEMRTSYAAHIANGESENEALKKVFLEKAGQLAMSAGTGFAMGSAMQGIPTLANDINARIFMNDAENRSQRVWDRVNAWVNDRKNSLNPLEDAQNNIEVTDISDEFEPFNPLEMARKNENIDNAVRQQEQAIEEINRLQKPTEEIIPQNVNEIPEVTANPQSVTPESVNDIPNLEEPDITSGEKGQRRVITNTMKNAGIVSQDDINNNPVIQKMVEYEKHSNDKSVEQARQDVANDREGLEREYTNGSKQINSDIDVDRSMLILQDLVSDMDAGNDVTANMAKRDSIMRNAAENGTDAGQFIQAFAKYANTGVDALLKATKIQNEGVKNWVSRNQKAHERNTRIAKALENMGHKPEEAPAKKPLSHEQVKNGVRAELEREFSSVSELFDENAIDFLATLAENKKIPVWQITDEVEHFLNHGEFYDITEDVKEPKKPTNQKFLNALNKLVNDEVRKEPERKSFEQIREEVRNTLDKENASIDDFSDEDLDYISNLMEQGATTKEIADALDTRLSTGNWGISAETQNKVNLLFEEARQHDENSREFVENQAEAFRLLANEVAPDASPLEKFEAWRYMAMLGNPKTMLRNYIGNKMFGAVVGVSNNLSAALEEGIDKAYYKKTGKHIQRTKAFINPVKDKDFIDAAKEDAFGKRFRQIERSKYEKPVKDAIMQQREVFDSKALQLYEKAVDAGVSDTKAVVDKYATSMVGYLKANGYDQSILKAQSEYDNLKQLKKSGDFTDADAKRMEELQPTIDVLEKARDYALKQADYATFHEDNAVAEALTKASNYTRNSDNRIVRGLGYALEGTIPFKKTPANILRSAFEYSPFGALKSIAETGKLIYENTGDRKGNLADEYTKTGKISGKKKTVQRSLAADVIDSWSKTITGTGLTLLGYYLFNKGILTSSTNDEKYQDQLEKIGNYGININGHTYTLDWAAPGVMPLLLGAEINKVAKDNAISDKEWYESPDRILETVNALLDPMMETSMLSGLKDTLQNAANEVRYNENNAIGGILGSMAGNTLTGYLTQGIPTISGQIARTVDPIRRTTDTVNEGILGAIEKQGRKAANKIPYLSMINSEYRDARGERQYNSPFQGEGIIPALGNLAYQMLSPGYYSKENTTAADQSARDTYNGLDEGNKPVRDPKVFADWKATKRINDEKLDPQQMQRYREIAGTTNNALREALAGAEWFNALPATDKTEILKRVNSLSDKIGQYNINPDSVTVQSEIKAFLDNQGGRYLNSGVRAVLDYMESEYNPYGLSKDTYQEMKESGEDLSQYTGYGEALEQYGLKDNKAYRDAYAEGGAEKLGEEIAYQSALKDAGLSDSESNRNAYGLGGADRLNSVADTKAKAIELGFTDADGSANTGAYQNAITVLGDDASAKNYAGFANTMKEKGYTKQEQYIPYLESTSMTDEQKGQYAYLYGGVSAGSSAEKVLKDKGYEYLYLYRLLQNPEDFNNDGKKNKYDRIKTLDSWGLDSSSDAYQYFIDGDLKY